MQPAAFDCLQTRAQLRIATQQTLARLAGPELVEVSALLDLPFARLAGRPDAAHDLCRLCRLLVRSGDSDALRQVARLADLIYTFERIDRSSHRMSRLYKGLAQIGLGVTNFGSRKVSQGLPDLAAEPWAAQHDRVLAHWALTSAAVALRDLRLARKLAAHWCASAEEAGMTTEWLRATVVQHIFGLLEDELRGDLPSPEALLRQAPPAWQPTVRLLWVWGLAVRDAPATRLAELLEEWPPDQRTSPEFACARSLLGGPSQESAAHELTPLLLGPRLDWCAPAIAAADLEVPFDQICQLRQRTCRAAALAELPLARLQSLAGTLASWELSRPHKRLELAIKQRDSECYYQSVLARLVGDHVRSYVDAESLGDTEVVTREDVLIWMCDVRGYSRLVAQLPPERVFPILSPLFKIMHEELGAVGGVIHEFVGDSIMVVFNGYSTSARLPDILAATARCLRRIFYLGTLRQQAGEVLADIGVGLNRGAVAIGYLGGRARCQLANLGNTVNVAARLESCTRELPCPVAIAGGAFAHGPSEVWQQPEQVGFRLRDLGAHTLKNIPEPCRIIGLAPLVHGWLEFVAESLRTTPEPGVVCLGVGRSVQPGIIDNQAAGSGARSTCSLLLAQPGLLREHLADRVLQDGRADYQHIEFRLPEDPSLDKTAALYIAYELLSGQPRLPLLHRLAAYVTDIEQGFLDGQADLKSSLYGIFMAHRSRMEKAQPPAMRDFARVEAGLRVIDAAMFVASGQAQDFGAIFASGAALFAAERRLLLDDIATYRRDRARGLLYQAPVGGRAEPATGLWLDQPESLLFKHWVRTDPEAPGGQGFGFMVVDWSHAGNKIFVISVDPRSQTHLQGLGAQLDVHEQARRATLRVPPAGWNHGTVYGHTIVMSPRGGSMLTADEVRGLHQSWTPEA